MNPPTQEETLSALEAHHREHTPKVQAAINEYLNRWEFNWHFAPRWQVALGVAWNDETMVGHRVCVLCFWIGCFALTLSWSKNVRYDQRDLDYAPKHACNINVALAREINKKEVELAGLVVVPDDGTISAGEIELGGKKFDVRYMERHP